MDKPKAKAKLKLLLADDQALFAEGLKTFLNNYADDMIVAGIVADGKAAVAMTALEKPDIILMDIRMPVMDGVAAVKEIKTAHPEIKIIMLSTYNEDEFVYSALQAGASGYLLKDISPTELIAAIRALNSGIMQISPAIARQLVEDRCGGKKAAALNEKPFEWLKSLTRREKEIFTLIARGYDNERIADTLDIAPQTVKNHVSTIYSKLDVKDRFEIIRLANQ